LSSHPGENRRLCNEFQISSKAGDKQTGSSRMGTQGRSSLCAAATHKAASRSPGNVGVYEKPSPTPKRNIATAVPGMDLASAQEEIHHH
jgi:hypothetical protein